MSKSKVKGVKARDEWSLGGDLTHAKNFLVDLICIRSE